MLFKIDENLPEEVSRLLKNAGHNAATVLEQHLSGASDKILIEKCRDENRILVTLDMDFCDIRIYPPSLYAGIIVLRLSRQDKRHVLTIAQRFIHLIGKEPIQHSLWVVDEGHIRIRE